MKSRRDSPPVFSLPSLLPSDEQMGPESSLQGWEELSRTDDATCVGARVQSLETAAARLFLAGQKLLFSTPCRRMRN